ncbi:HNH endonuclease [Nocardia aurea]|uniref:HNH endonuclease n=1 Tax=Nocardia aurea TaxID=2144174 RepID=A0ABV3G054_9NOCA
MVSEPKWTRDELILACDLVVENGWRQIREHDPRAKTLSDLLRSLRIHPAEKRGPRFRSLGSVSRKTADLVTIHPDYSRDTTRGSKLDREVLADFLATPLEMHMAAIAIQEGVATGELTSELSREAWDIAFVGDVGAKEGGLLATRHLRRERDRKLRSRKIADFLDSHDRVRCQLCAFDFEEVYGSHGHGFIECHHIVPLHASGETTTQLADLILLCSNCHSMIHYRKKWLEPAELRELLER